MFIVLDLGVCCCATVLGMQHLCFLCGFVLFMFVVWGLYVSCFDGHIYTALQSLYMERIGKK